jgi:hypothetical protein
LIFPDGSEREILRAGPASIREQVRLIQLAAATGADTLVSEMMSVGAECLAVESRRILRPGTLALTNVRLDHVDEMGRCKDDIARSLASAFPERADIFIPKEEIYPVFEDAAARTGSKLHQVAPLATVGGASAGPHLSFGEFEPQGLARPVRRPAPAGGLRQRLRRERPGILGRGTLEDRRGTPAPSSRCRREFPARVATVGRAPQPARGPRQPDTPVGPGDRRGLLP